MVQQLTVLLLLQKQGYNFLIKKVPIGIFYSKQKFSLIFRQKKARAGLARAAASHCKRCQIVNFISVFILDKYIGKIIVKRILHDMKFCIDILILKFKLFKDTISGLNEACHS